MGYGAQMHRVPWDLLLGATLAMALVGAGLFTAQSPALLGFEGGELWGHAWTQWWHGEALPAWPAGTPLATGSSDWPVIDPERAVREIDELDLREESRQMLMRENALRVFKLPGESV